MTVLALSVDPPADSLAWAQKKGFTLPLACDPEKLVIGRMGLVNPDLPDLSLHAVYIVDEQGKVFYRKIARRRAYSAELLDAIDHHYGRWSPPSSGS